MLGTEGKRELGGERTGNVKCKHCPSMWLLGARRDGPCPIDDLLE